MLKNYILITLSVLSFFNHAQLGTVNFIDLSVQTAGVSNFESIDLTGDGFNELLVSTTGGTGRLGYYQNLTNNTFSAFNLIEDVAFCRGFAVGNFNNDNLLDLVSIGSFNHEVKIHMNSSTSFTPGLVISTNPAQLNDVIVANFDNNNFDDFVVIGQHSIDFYRNDGNGIFSKEEILTTSTSPEVLECLDLTFEDLDNDGDLDLICGETAD